MKKIVPILLILLLLALDQLVKFLVVLYYPFLVYKNYGILFGFIKNPFAIYLLLGLGMVLLIWIVVRSGKKILNYEYLLPIILIASGAISNLIDRFVHGYVIDYLSFFGLNKFNLSDIMIILGVLLYAYRMLLEYKKS